MVLLSMLSVLLVAFIGDNALRICTAALCGLFLSQDLFTSVTMLVTILMEKTKLPLFDRLSILNIKDTCFTAGIFDKTHLLKSTKSILIFFLFAAIRNVIFTAVTLCICIVLHSEFNGSKDASIALGYLLVGIFIVFKLALYSRQLYILRLVKNPLMHYVKLANDVVKLKKYRQLLITILSVINVSFQKGMPSAYVLKVPCMFIFTGLSFVMLAYLSVALECGEGSCNETWSRIVLALTTVRSLRKVCHNLFCLVLRMYLSSHDFCVTDLAASSGRPFWNCSGISSSESVRHMG